MDWISGTERLAPTSGRVLPPGLVDGLAPGEAAAEEAARLAATELAATELAAVRGELAPRVKVGADEGRFGRGDWTLLPLPPEAGPEAGLGAGAGAG